MRLISQKPLKSLTGGRRPAEIINDSRGVGAQKEVNTSAVHKFTYSLPEDKQTDKKNKDV